MKNFIVGIMKIVIGAVLAFVAFIAIDQAGYRPVAIDKYVERDLVGVGLSASGLNTTYEYHTIVDVEFNDGHVTTLRF